MSGHWRSPTRSRGPRPRRPLPCRPQQTPQLRGARSPRSPATSPAQYPAGSGVGVSVLLRQPHGFEGLGWVHVDVPSDDLSAAKCPNVRDLFFDLHAAVLAVRAELHGGHDVIATVGKPYWDPVGVPERLEHLPPASPHAVVAVKRSLAPEHGRTLPHLDGWIEELKEP